MEIRYGFDSENMKVFGKTLLKYSLLMDGKDYRVTGETDTEIVFEVMPCAEKAFRNRLSQMTGIYEIITM